MTVLTRALPSPDDDVIVFLAGDNVNANAETAETLPAGNS